MKTPNFITDELIWQLLCKKTKDLNDNNFTARKIFDGFIKYRETNNKNQNKMEKQEVTQKPEIFTMNDLVSFGEYLLSNKRRKSFEANPVAGDYPTIEERLSLVHKEDIDNWLDEQSKCAQSDGSNG